ncbi:MAG: helix-turn-helix transcriptional regulator [Opitutaceae bacterium]|jgi:transcriptional regulator with XRE-family HTH domain
MDLSYKTSDESQVILGERLWALRLSRNFTQRELAEKAGVSLRALQNLEAGAGSTVETLLRALKGLNALDAIETLVPQPRVSPLALLKRDELPRRASHPRIKKGTTP